MLKQKILNALEIPLRGDYRYVYGSSFSHFVNLYAEDIRQLRLQETILAMTDFEVLEEIQIWERCAGETDFRSGNFSRLQLYKTETDLKPKYIQKVELNPLTSPKVVQLFGAKL